MSNIWSYSERRNGVVRCSYKCNRNHDHYIGSYDKALEYFGVSSPPPGYKKLNDIIIFHQLSENTLTKTSAELYDILIQACSKREYWVDEDLRHEAVMNALSHANKNRLIKDDEILKKARSEEGSNKNMMKRLYRQEKWERMVEFK